MDKTGTFEYEIRKDVRNNQIVREVDERRLRDLWQSLGIGVVLVLVLLFSAWQHFELLRHGYRLEQMQRERAAENDINRHLRLEMETLRAPQRIEKLATERLGMVAPGAAEAIVLERVTPPAAAGQVASSPPGRTSTTVAAPPDLAWRPTLQRRLAGGGGACSRCWVAGIEARLIVLQVCAARRSGRAGRSAADETQSPAPAKRGEIFDRHGRLLAYSVDADTIYAVPTEIDDNDEDGRSCCAAALEDCDKKFREQLLERLSRQRAFVYVKRRVAPLEAKRVAALGLEGIGFMKESKRFYPNRELAAHLIGYVGLDNVGLHGIEATYDKMVRGREGKLLVQTDARGHAFSRLERSPTAGGSIELTIDEHLQYIVERELRAGVEPSTRRRRHRPW